MKSTTIACMNYIILYSYPTLWQTVFAKRKRQAHLISLRTAHTAYVIVVYVLSSQYSGSRSESIAYTSTTFTVQSRRYTLCCRHSFACPTHLFSYFFLVFFEGILLLNFSMTFLYTFQRNSSSTTNNPRIKMKILLNIARLQRLLTRTCRRVF